MLRIVAGEFGGRKILPPPGATTRPMTGFAKKSLFGMIHERLTGAIVCDLYCGTGTLGLEALSRGARQCGFAEKDRRVVERLNRNIDTCGVRNSALVWPGNIERRLMGCLPKLDGPVDIAFVDPPFPAVRKWSWSLIETRLFAPLTEHLADGGSVILRTPDDAECPETLAGLTRRREKKYGQMTIAFYEKPN